MEQFQSSACCFRAADILLPVTTELERWAVIACDQFTSQPEYWQQVEAMTDGKPSSAHLILPESELGPDAGGRVERIHSTMLRYLQENVFREFPDCYVYTERRLLDGSLRCGIVGKIDLEAYDYTGTENAEVRATEETVSERIPPRMAVRRGAVLELPHILLLCDDDQRLVIEPLQEKRDSLPLLYNFELMFSGGHVSGWLVSGREKKRLDCELVRYTERQRGKYPHSRMLFAVGDGNHSLATAKACYEELKAADPGIQNNGHPARYALCELNNIHDPAQHFRPIHRLVKHCDAGCLLQDLQHRFPQKSGAEIRWYCAGREGTAFLPDGDGRLPLAVLQEFLDGWLDNHPGEMDYIHGSDTLRNLSHMDGAVGFLLPALEKEKLFPGILSDGVLPRKTFSMGAATEKRYYLEARRIL